MGEAKKTTNNQVIITDGFNDKELKNNLINIKSDANKLEGKTRIIQIANSLKSLIELNKDNVKLIDEKTKVIKKSALVKHCFDLASYDKKTEKNGSFENIVTRAIELSLLITSDKYKKAKVIIKDNKIIAPSNIIQPDIQMKAGTDGKRKKQPNPSTEPTDVNIVELKSIFNDFTKKSDGTSKQSRETLNKLNHNLATGVRERFTDLEKFLIDKFAVPSQKLGGRSIWNTDLINNHLSINLINDMKSKLIVLSTFIYDAERSLNNDNKQGKKTGELGLVRPTKAKSDLTNLFNEIEKLRA